MAALDLLNRLASSAVGRQFEEAVTVAPKGRGGYGFSGPDTLRPAKAVRAIVSISPQDEKFSGQNANGQILAGRSIAGAQSSIWISGANMAKLGYDLRKDDVFTLTSRPGQPRYRIEDKPTNDLGDVTCVVTAGEEDQ